MHLINEGSETLVTVLILQVALEIITLSLPGTLNRWRWWK